MYSYSSPVSALLDNLPYLLWGAFPDGPLGGAALTLLMSLAAGIASLVMGIAAGVLTIIAWPPVRWALRFVLGFLRAIPPMLVIFWLYFFLIPLIPGINGPRVETAIIALSLLSTAYIAISMRAGILSIEPGQWQAGLSLGLTPLKTLRYIVLPQALRVMLPSFVNQFIALIKDTSLAYVIGVSELTYVASQVNSQTLIYPADIFFFVACVYFVICFSLSMGAEQLTKRLGRSNRNNHGAARSRHRAKKGSHALAGR